MTPICASLVAKRIAPCTERQGGQPPHTDGARFAALSRFGLAAPARIATTADPASKRPFGKSTFKMPKPMLHALKAFAKATGQFQYVAADEAIRQYLAREIASLDSPRREMLEALRRQYDLQDPMPVDLPNPAAVTPKAPEARMSSAMPAPPRPCVVRFPIREDASQASGGTPAAKVGCLKATMRKILTLLSRQGRK